MGQGESPEKSKTAQILWENFAQKTGLHGRWTEEAISAVLAPLPLFLDACVCVWLDFPRKLALETQNPIVNTFDREVPKLRVTGNLNLNLQVCVCSAADT